jgi:hypothetical protein
VIHSFQEGYLAVQNIGQRHARLWNIWEIFKNGLKGVTSVSELPSEVREACEIREVAKDEVRFSFLGLECYARFRSAVDAGSIEYGVIHEGALVGTSARIAIQRIGFDRYGNVGSGRIGERSIRDTLDAVIIHMEFLAETLPEWLRSEVGNAPKGTMTAAATE